MSVNPKFIVEGLRSGVPYRDMAKTVGFGREKHLDTVRGMMQKLEHGRVPEFPAHVIRANYGEGKTHLLHSLWGLAEDMDWVVSYVSLSKETPLDRLDYLFPKLMENTYVPGSAQPGIEQVVARALDAQLLAEARALELSPRVMALLDSLVVQNEGYEELIADISGTFMTAAELKRIYRANLGKPTQLPRVSMQREAFEYLRLVDFLIRKSGCKGWLILFDEVELIGKLGRGARSKAYANMGRILSGVLPTTLSIWALAANFHSDVVIRRNDREECPRWLEARPKEADSVAWCAKGLDALIESKLLEPLSQAQLKSLMDQIHDMHQRAYNWIAPFSSDGLYEQVRKFSPTQDTRLRTWIRLSLTILDTWYQHGEEPVIEYLTPLQDSPLEEELELVGSSSREESALRVDVL